MRPKGGMDLRATNASDLRAQLIFNANAMGLFHGGQGLDISAPYVREVTGDFDGFQSVVLQATKKALKQLSEQSGMDAPKGKKLGN